jgi:hypothetical protein
MNILKRATLVTLVAGSGLIFAATGAAATSAVINDGQAGVQGESQIEQTGDQGAKENEQIGDQGAKENEQTGDHGTSGDGQHDQSGDQGETR